MVTLMEFINSIFLSLKYAVRDIVVLPGENLKNVLKYALIIAACSVASHFLGLITFVDWRGALLGCLLLWVVTLIGRRNKDEIPGSNGTGNLSSQNAEVGDEVPSIEREVE